MPNQPNLAYVNNIFPLAKTQLSSCLTDFERVVTDREVLHDRANMDEGLKHGWVFSPWQLQPKREGIWNIFYRLSG